MGYPAGDQSDRQHPKAWWRFRGNRLAKVSGVLLCCLFVTSVGTLPFSLRWYNLQALDHAVRHGPAVEPAVPYAEYARALPIGKPPPGKATISPAPDEADEGDSLGGPPRGVVPSLAPLAHHASSWLGHDDLGRSLLFRILPGFLVSMAIGLAAAAMAVMLGTTWGAVAALVGGRVDTLMMRVVDVLYGLPYILMVILLKVALTRPLTTLLGGHSKHADVVILFIAIGGVSWLTMARVIRGQVLSLRSQPFVEAARAAGAGPVRILLHHILPNLLGPLVVYATLVVPQAVLQESFLSFLGIGVPQPVPSLGRLAADGVEAVNVFVGFWWLLVFPCGFLVVTLLALNFVGDGLRDAFDPKASVTALP